jgi:hypothetical protein
VNLNGTSHAELQRQNFEARHALQNAIEALNAAAPHGRDYQNQGDPTVIFRAIEEHADRVNHLRLVLSELEVIAEHLS